MARLIQKSGYFKGGSTGYMKYIAKRDGVEITSDTGPVTEKQRQLIEDLLKNYSDTKELFEYEDYLITPNRATASAYIAAALDSHLHEMEPESGYMKYIAQRPRAEKHGGHGLFSAAPVTDLNKAVAELDAHTGRVWTFIFSLRREDAVQTGYDNAAAWRELLLQQSGTLAEALRIPQDKLRWYAAFHDEGYHPHVHMMVWSDDPRMGHLTKKGIFAMRSKLTGTIFREELKDVYIRKESIYKRSIQTAQEKLLELTAQMEQRTCPDTGIEQMMLELSQQLPQLSGKHQYGYLPKPVKATVDAIVDRLAQLPEVAACYAQWNQVKDELVRFHNQNLRQHLPLSQQKEFRVLLNAVIREAENMPTRFSVVLHEEPPDLEETDTPEHPAHTPPQGNTQIPQRTEDVPQQAGTLSATIHLLHHMSRIFRHDALISPATLRIDSKRRRRLQEKRMAMSHKRDDHEDEQLYHVNDNTMQ